MTIKDLLVVDWEPPAPAVEGEAAAPAQPRDRRLRRIPKEKLRRVDNDDPILAPLQPLIDRKVAIAAIPENFGEGTACYLINLTRIKTGE
ncbi:MAG: hypothetical protein ABW321_29320 [Polyangiales bacterium]